MGILVKFKSALAALFAAYVASTMRYIRAKRAGKRATFLSWFLFGATAWLVTFSALKVMDYCCTFLDYEAKLGIAFWCGYMNDYFYTWIPEYIKKKLEDESNK